MSGGTEIFLGHSSPGKNIQVKNSSGKAPENMLWSPNHHTASLSLEEMLAVLQVNTHLIPGEKP